MTTVTVRSGDTLSAIARANNTTVDALVKANNIQNPNLIFAGQTITIVDRFDSGAPVQTNSADPMPRLQVPAKPWKLPSAIWEERPMS